MIINQYFNTVFESPYCSYDIVSSKNRYILNFLDLHVSIFSLYGHWVWNLRFQASGNRHIGIILYYNFLVLSNISYTVYEFFDKTRKLNNMAVTLQTKFKHDSCNNSTLLHIHTSP